MDDDNAQENDVSEAAEQNDGNILEKLNLPTIAGIAIVALVLSVSAWVSLLSSGSSLVSNVLRAPASAALSLSKETVAPGDKLILQIRPSGDGVGNAIKLLQYSSIDNTAPPQLVATIPLGCKESACRKNETVQYEIPEGLADGAYALQLQDRENGGVISKTLTVVSDASGKQAGKPEHAARPLTGAERKAAEEAPYRAIDGWGNNLQHPQWGTPHVQLLRNARQAYADGVSEPAGQDRPNPRAISNAVAAQDEPVLNERGLSDMLWQWGQFVDHDITLTETAIPPEPLPISVPTGDPYFDPFGTGDVIIHFTRSVYDEDTGTKKGNPREQLNTITAFLDGSVVYGSDEERADALRAFSDGKLKTTGDGKYPPYNTAMLPNAPAPIPSFYLLGDVRANESLGLLAVQTLFVREHNRYADALAEEHPDWNDEKLYQETRRYIGALLQKITYDDWLPALLGRPFPEYNGYNQAANPNIATEFSTAMFRFGHSAASRFLARYDENGDVYKHGHVELRDGFFNPTKMAGEGGIAPMLRGLVWHEMQKIDTKLIDDLRNFLFGPPGAGGFDLDALNIQRGRDHGLPDYNTVRRAYGLRQARTFSDITSDADLAESLADVYGSVDNVDVFVGALAEDHIANGSVGPLIEAALVDQFARIRNGDRYWYERIMTPAEINKVKNTTLADIIIRNTDVESLQSNVFFTQ